jgi:hypothetical protein
MNTTFIKTRRNPILLIFLITLFYFNSVNAQDINYKVHSMFMYHFTKHVDWPEAKKSGDFVIGVLGNSPIISELEAIAVTKKAGNQLIVIKKLDSEADVTSCHIVFLPANKSGNLEGIITSIGTKPVLIVAEKAGLGKKGACLNFIIHEDKLKFEINKQSIEAKNMKISGDLLKLGILL